jgi:penicillin-binding protein 2
MKQHYEIRNPEADKSAYSRRLYLSLVLALLAGLMLVWRYMDLQVFQYQRFITASDRNRIHTQPLAPRRGLIFDRNGIVLAENQPSFSLAVTKERVPDMSELLAELQQLFDIDAKTIEKFKQQRRRPYQAVPLKFRLNDDEIGRYAVNRHRLPGVEIKAQLVRHYPMKEYFSHVIGYVGRINTEEQESIVTDDDKRINYAASDYIGKLGLESYYENSLHGAVGSQYAETNAHGRVLRVLDNDSPVPGLDLNLTIDAGLQKMIHDSLQGKRASVVVVEVQTGAVLAMVSTPAYDPNLFVTGISTNAYSKLRDSIDLPLFNRSLQGQYPPGSTIKPMIGLAGLHYRVVHQDSEVYDPGWYQLPTDDRFYRDWKRGGHGTRINLHQAIEQSCDVYFYDLAYKLGVDRIHEFLAQFGLGEKTGIDSTSERSGLLPSRNWKKRSRQQPWFPGETLNIGIGQGYMLTTPLQLATATAVLANRGKRVTPHLVKTTAADQRGGKKIDAGRESSKTSEATASTVANKPDDIASVHHWDIIHRAMEAVVHDKKGTARAIGNKAGYRMAGKTGTAQVIGIAQNAEYDAEAIAERQRDHALFVGFAPLEKPTVAVAVVVENGGSGSATAAPIARAVFDWVIHREKNKPRIKNRDIPWYAFTGKNNLQGRLDKNVRLAAIKRAYHAI